MEIIRSNPLVDKEYILQKFHGKGGWTFAMIPEILKEKHSHFGLVKVSGSIDDFQISNYNLMPMGNGNLFLPVKAEIRKKIGKNEGDWVHIILFSENLPNIVHEDFFICLNDEPQAQNNFNRMSPIEQQKIIDWIYSAKRDDVIVERMAHTINKLSNNLT